MERETHSIVKPAPSNCMKESELYTKLHLAVLHSLRAGKRSHGPSTAVNAKHLASLMPLVQSYAQQLVKRGIHIQNDSKLQVSLRFILFPCSEKLLAG